MLHIKVAEKFKTYFIFNIFFPENHPVNDTMWKYVVQPDRQQMTICAEMMRYACRTKARIQTQQDT